MTLWIERYSLADVAATTGGRLTEDSHASARPNAVGTDTRSLAPGALFFALRGERFDGHDFVEQAASAGACAVVVDTEQPVDVPQIVVSDCLVALQQLGADIFRRASDEGLRSIALTGSNGKTTTKELLVAVWRACGAHVHATKGNFNNHIGVPLTLCALPVGADTIIIEMGTNQFGDIEELVALAPADLRVLTSIGYAHLENLGNLDGVRRAKSELFRHSDDARLAVVPETERMRIWLNEFAGSVATVGSSQQGGSVTYAVRNDRVSVIGADFAYHLNITLPGQHNLHNLATAIATLHDADEPPTQERLQVELDRVELPGGRWRRVQRGAWVVLDDAYNANPSSVRASWDAFVEIAPSDDAVVDASIVAVIGEMFELGEDAEALHRETASWVAQRGGANTFVFVGGHAQAMAEAAALQTSADVMAFDDATSTAQWLVHQPPAVVYLKASRGQALEKIIDHLPEEP